MSLPSRRYIQTFVKASEPININLWQLLRERLGAKGRFVPHWIVRPFEKLIHQEDMNELLAETFPRRGADFCNGILSRLDIRLSVCDEKNLPDNPRCIIVCNHPLGGLDGMSVIAWLTEHYGIPVNVVVNDLLNAVEPLSDIFLPVNKFGSQNRGSVSAIDLALEGNAPVIFFPAGLVSRLHPDGTIRDLEWKKAFVTKAIHYKRDVVPVYFDGYNSGFFYRMGLWRRRLRLRTNFEQTLLPRELFLSRGSTFRIVCGRPIPWTELRGGAEASASATKVCDTVYSLAGVTPSETKEVIWK